MQTIFFLLNNFIITTLVDFECSLFVTHKSTISIFYLNYKKKSWLKYLLIKFGKAARHIIVQVLNITVSCCELQSFTDFEGTILNLPANYEPTCKLYEKHACIKKSMPTAIVVPSAKPKAKSVAAKAATLKGMRGWN